MKKIKFLAVLAFFAIAACDKIDDPIPEGLGISGLFVGGVEIIPDPSFDLTDTNSIKTFIDTNVWTTINGGDNSNTKFVTLEEFTGHRCTSCPTGTREITRLKGIFNERLIPIGIHTGTFAVPDKSGSPQYSTDFRVGGDDDDAFIYVDRFGVEGNPRGIVNRIGVAGAETTWESSIRTELANLPDAKLALTTHYDSVNNVIRAQADIEWNTTPSSNNMNIQLYVIEGKIFDWQLDNGVINPNYEHKFVLRKIVNGTFGRKLRDAEIGDTEKVQYIFKADSKWKAKNVEVVAFVFNNVQGAYKVIQANSAFVK